jgi:glycosyltransferase involved in cell wall biosynthesis
LAIARRLRCELVFERYSIFGVIGALLSAHLSLPWVLEVNYTSRSPLVRQRSQVLGPLASFLERKLFGRATGLVAVSSYLKKQLVADYGVRPSNIMVLPNAADPVVFRPGVQPQVECAGKPLDGKIIGFVGGFYPWHGLKLLLDAFLSLVPEFPAAKLLLIGDGPEKQSLMDRVAQAGAGRKVFFAGRVDHKDLPKWVSAFHIGVMPDSNEYGSPMKVFEYMSMGKPVVVPDYAPLRDAVEDGVEGFIFPPGSTTTLAERMRTLLGNPQTYARMADAARRRVVLRHNWEQNARTILEKVHKGGRV